MKRSPSIRCQRSLDFLFIFIILISQKCYAAYYGKLIGKLSQLNHGLSGEVYAVDVRTLFIKDFNYDGEGPAAYFYAGASKTPGVNGFKVPDERGTTNNLRRYRNDNIVLNLPEGKTLNNIKWFSVYCDEFSVNFGDVKIPRGFDYPRPQKLDKLSGIHGVDSEPVVIVDAQTILVPGFSYDGRAPAAYFWAGAGPTPSNKGIQIADENGKEEPLRKYDRKTIVLTIPGDLTIHKLGHFGVWCEKFFVDFAHIKIPENLNVPPSLKMLGITPQKALGGQGQRQSLITAHSQNIHQISVPQQHRYQRPQQQHTLVEIVPALGYRIQKAINRRTDFEDDDYQDYIRGRLYNGQRRIIRY